MAVNIDKEYCVGCGSCVEECPVGALEIPEDETNPVWDEDVCIECGTCIETCPMGAVSMD